MLSSWSNRDSFCMGLFTYTGNKPPGCYLKQTTCSLINTGGVCFPSLLITNAVVTCELLPFIAGQSFLVAVSRNGFPSRCLWRKENNHRSGAACAIGRSVLLSIYQPPNNLSNALLLIKLVFGGNVSPFDSMRVVHWLCL